MEAAATESAGPLCGSGREVDSTGSITFIRPGAGELNDQQQGVSVVRGRREMGKSPCADQSNEPADFQRLPEFYDLMLVGAPDIE